MSTVDVLLVTAVSFGAAVLSAIVGMGGGSVLVGTMSLVLPGAAVIPVHGVVQLASNATRTLAFLSAVRWRLFFLFAPGLVAGTAVAAWVYSGVKFTSFRLVIGGFLVVAVLWRRWAPALRRPPHGLYVVVGFVSGVLALFVGATGPFVAPFFQRDDLDKEHIVATKAVCQSLTHALKVPAFLALGFAFDAYAVPLLCFVLAVVAGTFVGKQLLTRISRRSFERLFEIVLLGLAAVLIVSGVRALSTP